MKRFTEMLKRNRIKAVIIVIAALSLVVMGQRGFPSWPEIWATRIHSQNAGGVTTADSLAVTGDFRVGAVVSYLNKLGIKNDAVNLYAVSVYNSRGTLMFRVDSSGYRYSSTTVRDSFLTTSATDSVTLNTVSGLTTSSKVFVSKWNPTWSTDVDTAEYSGSVVLTGAGLTKLCVTRAKSTTTAGATAVKSGAHYFAIIE